MKNTHKPSGLVLLHCFSRGARRIMCIHIIKMRTSLFVLILFVLFLPPADARRVPVVVLFLYCIHRVALLKDKPYP